jgi:hypothetical protein
MNDSNKDVEAEAEGKRYLIVYGTRSNAEGGNGVVSMQAHGIEKTLVWVV